MRPVRDERTLHSLSDKLFQCRMTPEHINKLVINVKYKQKFFNQFLGRLMKLVLTQLMLGQEGSCERYARALLQSQG